MIEKFEIDERLSLNELFQSYLDSGDYQKYIKNAIKILNFKNGTKIKKILVKSALNSHN